MGMQAQRMPGKSGQKSSATTTASETTQSTKSVASTVEAQRIPAWATMADGLPRGLMLQTKLAVSQPGDPFEQEADRVAEQVMRMPEPQLQRACACGGTCHKCQTEHSSQEDVHLQTKSIQSSDTGQSAAPPIVQEALRSPGQPLDQATRTFMEPQFGYDFSKVRVHTGAAAERSAVEVNAHAYTVGHDMVFAADRFAPGTHEGRQLLAHELTHVVQQGQSTILQRKKSEAAIGTVNDIDPHEDIDYKLDFAKLMASSSNIAIIIVGQFLDIFELEHNTNLGAFRIHINEQKIAAFFNEKLSDIPFMNMPFVVFGFDTDRLQINPTAHYAHANDTPFSPQELNETYFTVSSWFSSKKDKETFRNLIAGKKAVLFISRSPSSVVSSKQAPEKKTPPIDMGDFRKKLEHYVQEIKAREPASIDLPDKTGLYFDPKEGQWKIRAYQRDANGKMTHLVFVDLKKNATKEDVLDKIRKSIRKEIVNDDKKSITIDGEKQSISSKFSWAYDLLHRLEKLIADDRKKTRGIVDNLPDKISLSGSSAMPDKIYLSVAVFVENRATMEDIQNLEKGIPIIDVGVTLRSATIPFELKPSQKAEELFPIVRNYAYALRHSTTDNKPAQAKETEKYERVLEPYPAAIRSVNVRPDFQAVTGGTLKFRMVVDVTKVEGENALSLSVYMNPIHYVWRVYAVDDLFKEQPADLEKFSSEWETRRSQLIAYFKSKSQIKSQPLVNIKATEDMRKALSMAAPNASALIKEIFYGDSGLSPDAEFTLPDKAGDYLVYCSAQTEPFGNTIQLPSEAFFPIRLREGFELAESTLEKYSDKELAKLEQQLAETTDENTKEKLRQQIHNLTSRSLRDLTDPTKSGSKIAAAHEEIRIAQKLLDLFGKYYSGNNLKFEQKLAEDKKDYPALSTLWLKMKQLPGYTQENIKAYINDWNNIIKGTIALHGRIKEFDDDIDYSKPIYTPTLVLISDETGQEYQLISILGYEKNYFMHGRSRPRVILVDVSTDETQKKYYSDDTLDAEASEVHFSTLARQAFEDFAGTCKYGEGYIAYSVPGLSGVKGQIRGKCSTTQKIKNILRKLAIVAGIAAFILGTIASGGALGVAATVVGATGAVIGAGLALSNIMERAANHRLHMDVEFALDVINVIAPFSMGAMALTRASKLGLVTEGIEDAAKLSSLKGIVRLEKGIALYQKAEMGTNFILTNYKICEDLDKINQMNIPDEQKDVLRKEVLANGILANMMFGTSISHEFSPEAANNKRLNDLILSQGNADRYNEANIRSGIYNPDGTFNTEVAKEYEPAESTLKGPEQTQAGQGTPAPENVSLEAFAKQYAIDVNLLKVEVDELRQDASDPDKVHSLDDPSYDAEITTKDKHTFRRRRGQKKKIWCRSSPSEDCGELGIADVDAKVDATLKESERKAASSAREKAPAKPAIDPSEKTVPRDEPSSRAEEQEATLKEGEEAAQQSRSRVRELAEKKLEALQAEQAKTQTKIEQLEEELHAAEAKVRNLSEKVRSLPKGSEERARATEEFKAAKQALEDLREEDELGGYREERSEQSKEEDAILESLGLKRPALWESTKDTIKKAAKKNADGKFLDANTGEVIEGEPVYGHKKGFENRRILLKAASKGMTQEQLTKWVNDHPQWFQLETKANNESHKFEEPGIKGWEKIGD